MHAHGILQQYELNKEKCVELNAKTNAAYRCKLRINQMVNDKIFSSAQNAYSKNKMSLIGLLTFPKKKHFELAPDTTLQIYVSKSMRVTMRIVSFFVFREGLKAGFMNRFIAFMEIA